MEQARDQTRIADLLESSERRNIVAIHSHSPYLGETVRITMVKKLYIVGQLDSSSYRTQGWLLADL